MDDPDFEERLERYKYDTAREMKLGGPGGNGYPASPFTPFVLVCLMITVIAVISGIDSVQGGRLPILEAAVIVAVLVSFVLLFLYRRRRLQRWGSS